MISGEDAYRKIEKIDDSIFYMYSDENISYCSQVTAEGNIQFSYVSNDNKLIESEIFKVDDAIFVNSISSVEAEQIEKLNATIINNIKSFDKIKSVVDLEMIDDEMVEPTAVSNDISDEITRVFGENYTGKLIKQQTKTYNGKSYTVNCKENQLSSYTTPEKHPFEKDAALTEIVAWAISRGWGWKKLAVSTLLSIITTVLENGVYYAKYKFTAQRTIVTITNNRNVYVKGNSSSQYWAGRTRKRYFIKGDKGWYSDYANIKDTKHTDYSSTQTLIDKGFQNYVNFVLN